MKQFKYVVKRPFTYGGIELKPGDDWEPDNGRFDSQLIDTEHYVRIEEVASADVDATPGATVLAKEHGLDLTTINGTGANGRVLKKDIEAALEEQ